MSQESLFSHGGAGGEFRHELGRRRAEAVVDASSVLYLLCSCSDQRGRKKEEYLVYMDMVVPDGSLSTVSRRRQPGEKNCTRNFVLCFCLIFFRASKWGDRASSRGLVLRLGLRHRRSDPIVITDRSSSLCVHGPPGSIRWAELVCGRLCTGTCVGAGVGAYLAGKLSLNLAGLKIPNWCVTPRNPPCASG